MGKSFLKSWPNLCGPAWNTDEQPSFEPGRIRMTNYENPSRPPVSGFRFRNSFVIRHSSFVISLAFLLFTIGLAAPTLLTAGEPPPATITISPQPLHAGHINPMLFGNFIELLDDLVPGLWAEMLNDRSFEGVTRLSNWVYYD